MTKQNWERLAFSSALLSLVLSASSLALAQGKLAPLRGIGMKQSHPFHGVSGDASSMVGFTSYRFSYIDFPNAADTAMLKKQLAVTVEANDASARQAYASAKSEFIERVVQIALAAGYPHQS